MKIALIDSGIDAKNFPHLTVEADLVVEENGSIRPRLKNEPIITSHGTTCARIIHQYAPTATFCSLALFHTARMQGSITQVVSALDWCFENQIPLIHMSIGSTRLSDYQPIQAAVSRILQQNQVIVAAHSNQAQQYTMPACFLGVFGVEADSRLSENEHRVDKHYNIGESPIKASSTHYLPDGSGNIEKTIFSNSYAAPTITAKLHQILSAEALSTNNFLGLYRKLADDPNARPLGTRPDFLSDTIIFGAATDLSDLSQGKNISQYPSQSAFLAAIKDDPQSSLLILPPLPKAEDSFWNAVISLSSCRTGIAVDGTAPELLKRRARCIVWDSDDRRALISQLPENHAALSAPLIQIEPWGTNAFRVLLRFKKLLECNGYQCVAMSDYPLASMCGIEHIPPKNALKKWALYCEQHLHPDVFLCMAEDVALSWASVLDVLLKPTLSTSYDSSNDRAVVPANPSDEDLYDLLSYIT